MGWVWDFRTDFFSSEMSRSSSQLSGAWELSKPRRAARRKKHLGNEFFRLKMLHKRSKKQEKTKKMKGYFPKFSRPPAEISTKTRGGILNKGGVFLIKIPLILPQMWTFLYEKSSHRENDGFLCSEGARKIPDQRWKALFFYFHMFLFLGVIADSDFWKST